MGNQWAKEDRAAFGRLRLVGVISLWFCIVALSGLVVTLYLVDDTGSDYLARLQAVAVTQKHLPGLMLGGGSLLLLGTGLTTWLITQYSSWRVSGPLQRLVAYLEADLQGRFLPAVVVDDPHARDLRLWGAEARLLEQAVVGLDGYYRQLESDLARLEVLLEEQDPQALSAALAELERKKHRVRLGG